MSRYQTFKVANDEAAGDDIATPLLDTLAEAVNRFNDKGEALRKAGEEITYRIERVNQAVANGQQVNSLGELQSQGPNYDRLCGERQAAAEEVVRLAWVARKVMTAAGDDETVVAVKVDRVLAAGGMKGI